MEQDVTKRDLGLVVILAVLLAAGSLFHNFWFDRSLTRDQASAFALQQQLGSIETALADLRAAETGYLAAGQNPDFWMRRATELSEHMASTVATARQSAMTADAREHLDAVSTSLASLMALDKRARDQIQMDQRLLAGDILLNDGLADTQRMITELAGARTAESLAATASAVKVGRIRLGLNALGALLVLGLVLLASKKPVPVQTAASSAAQTAQMLRELPPPVKAATNGATPTPAVTRPIITAPVAPPPIVNLPEAAELCVDLARVMDTRDIPTLLERAATVLGAKGVIVWMADGNGTRLRPSLTHGYSDRVITRLDTLEIAAENVTSLSFRSMRPQVMNGAAAGSAGAVAVPLITAAGCTGVLSAETRESKPAQETIAVARILAAQFATLIAPGDAATTQAAAEA